MYASFSAVLLIFLIASLRIWCNFASVSPVNVCTRALVRVFVRVCVRAQTTPNPAVRMTVVATLLDACSILNGAYGLTKELDILNVEILALVNSLLTLIHPLNARFACLQLLC